MFWLGKREEAHGKHEQGWVEFFGHLLGQIDSRVRNATIKVVKSVIEVGGCVERRSKSI